MGFPVSLREPRGKTNTPACRQGGHGELEGPQREEFGGYRGRKREKTTEKDQNLKTLLFLLFVLFP
jgi:hypothetical protein